MGWNRHDEDYRADHARDLAKHEIRPGDRGFSQPSGTEPPSRLITSISEALEVAILCKCVPLPQAAELIELYARNVAAQQRLDAVAAGAQP